MTDADEIISSYRCQGLTCDEILFLLDERHGVSLSKRSLERRLAALSLTRKDSEILDVVEFIQTELDGSGRMHGYRWMHQKLLLNGLKVSRETVRLCIRLLDRAGVELRARNRLRRRQYFTKGPNYVSMT